MTTLGGDGDRAVYYLCVTTTTILGGRFVNFVPSSHPSLFESDSLPPLPLVTPLLPLLLAFVPLPLFLLFFAPPPLLLLLGLLLLPP